MHISLSWDLRGYLSYNVGYLLGHTDTSKAQCLDCGKLLSLGSNKPGKQAVHGLKCHLEKCHKDIYMRNVESHQQGPPAKKAKLDEVLTAHCRADLVTECMKKSIKKLILSGDFHFRFRSKINVYFRFVFSRRWNSIFVGIFVYSRKWKMLFGRPLVYITKRSWSWSWIIKSWFWTLGLVLVLVLVLKEF